MAKDGIELAFQNVEGLGILIEFENERDFEGKSYNEIKEEKRKMYDYIKNIGIDITEEIHIKKAVEIIKLNMK